MLFYEEAGVLSLANLERILTTSKAEKGRHQQIHHFAFGAAPVKAMSCSGAETVSPLLPLRYKMVQVSQFVARPCSGKQHTREVLYQCDRCFGTRHFVCVWRGCLFVVCSAGYGFQRHVESWRRCFGGLRGLRGLPFLSQSRGRQPNPCEVALSVRFSSQLQNEFSSPVPVAFQLQNRFYWGAQGLDKS